MILLIDNYDSFTYNVYQAISILGFDVDVHRNDKISIEKIKKLQPSQIIISPGPGRPDDAGISKLAIKEFGGKIPILGICLGHQAIAEVFGGKVIHAPKMMHGKPSKIIHDGKTIYQGLKNPFVAGRYHSLTVDEKLPDSLEISCYTLDGEIMGIRHREFNIEGVQFHPESIMTVDGLKLFENFLGDKNNDKN